MYFPIYTPVDIFVEITYRVIGPIQNFLCPEITGLTSLIFGPARGRGRGSHEMGPGDDL